MYFLLAHSTIYWYPPARLDGVIRKKFTIWTEDVAEQDLRESSQETEDYCTERSFIGGRVY